MLKDRSKLFGKNENFAIKQFLSRSLDVKNSQKGQKLEIETKWYLTLASVGVKNIIYSQL